jgi:hypothetical protein
MHGRKNDQVESFLQTLPESGTQDLARLLDGDTSQEHWISKVMTHMRNQASHYNGKWNWEDLEWGHEAGRRRAGRDRGGQRQAHRHAPEVRRLHRQPALTRKFPEYVADPDAELDQETIENRLSTLFQVIAQTSSAALNFAAAAVNAYLDTLPDGVVRAES